ncbi:aminotransferase class V-fold PLP-dependent enzyme [Ruegeria pomeroyi]|uniref:Serine--glyoxylate transaminase, putative n=2 Tax=Ruegeria pomeroyi TaxID=89184 RepID=Q5LP23_RUEPO|nr:aminotransferase class V-fold PLP-dependent enzyme [Ruegeria pomeroyi]HCE72516.1 aminotransferase class V-fold PLP-dependent enzyme [Ruegeria sp.]AAV96265.1 serine--glyoxylate transaminase, putative [Ruegeria pomeroyi DSS-3]NVK99094.1 alanine--glyoxylate aminotransferase family protein [Ruegeria pomeroyi]NVL02335.1 alanine--glyoxylate aminotransferase family protein [Ruegeria pomeroyi]QWV09815.1 aminotransferase class V-fold PLP-dependent enzyme [Ruegeria pomeroyi]
MTGNISLAQGRGYLAIPGPSVMPDAVLRAMHRAAPNIYAGELVDMMPGLMADLRRVVRTAHHATIYICNGHGAWEAALSNVIAPGEVVLVPASGRFAHGWAEMAEGLGAECQVIDFGKSAPWDMDRIAEALKADTAHRIKAVLAVHVDTSSSIRNDIAGLRAVLDALGHPALLMADCIASLGCDVFEMDGWGVDVTVTASQKGLMVPPGVGFVFFNERAAAKRASMPRVSRYWDWVPRANPTDFYQYFDGTAPTHHLYGLRTALDMIHAEGIEHVWARHAVLARAIWAACSVWAEGGDLVLNVADPAHRSHAVTALRLDSGKGTALRQWTETNLGLTLGIGLGMAAPGDPAYDKFFRLGHMGHLNGQMVMGLLGGVEAGLRALDVPCGKGALEAAAEVLAAG